MSGDMDKQMIGEMENVPIMKELDNDVSQVSVEEMIVKVGEFKKYQWIVCAIFCITLFPASMQMLVMYFAALNPTWRCAENSTLCISNGIFSPENKTRCLLPRSEWEYTKEKEYSIVTEFDINCDDSWLIELSTSIMFVGGVCGSLVLGWASDTYGRRKIIFISAAMMILSGFLTAVVPNVYAITFFRFVNGFFAYGAFQSAVLLCEIVAGRYRPIAGTLIWCLFPICLSFLALKAYFIRSWKVLCLACSAPYAFALLFYFFAPESPQWLRMKGQTERLMKLFAKMAKFNDTDIPPHLTIAPAPRITQKSNPLHLFRSCNRACMTMIIGYCGFVNGMVYYGFQIMGGQLGGSLYLNFALLSLSEIPGDIGGIYLVCRFGRKKATIFGLLCAGVSCIALVFLTREATAAMVAFGMLGKLFITLSWNSLAIWEVELYPTSVRAQAVAFASIISTIGAATAPWMITGLTSVHEKGAFILMGVAIFVCSLLLLFIKETKGLPMLEDDSEKLSENNTV